MVVAVNGASSAPAGRLRRQLRRGLLIAALAAAGWVLSVLFATTASATAEPPAEHTAHPESSDTSTQEPGTEPAEEPATEPAPGPDADPAEGPDSEPAEPPATEAPDAPSEPSNEQATEPADGDSKPSGGLLGGVTHTVTNTVSHAVHQVTHTVSALTGTAGRTIPPALDQVIGLLQPPAGATLPDTAQPGARVPVPAAPPASPASPAPLALAPEHTPRLAVTTTPQRTSVPHGITETGAHAAKHRPGKPVESPAPLGPGSTSVSSAHDNAGGARCVHGVLTVSTALPAPAAGFTTRGRAADATGRVAGLPATSPD